ncbi:hypothetical protein [Flavobacterium sp.]|uniref:hypothetical protein n=1 Tax=Flavobacterium sp. TaxID=239 RepID=UPI0039E4BAF6
MFTKASFFGSFKTIVPAFLLLWSSAVFSQTQPDSIRAKSDFWQRVQFGGGIGLSIGSGYTDIALAPGAIYNFNPYVAAGVGLQGSYVRVKNEYESYIYGGSLIGLFRPVEYVQLSLELEQLRVNTSFSNFFNPDPANRYPDDNFWNTALYIGAGYAVENVTIGIRYNLLFDRDKSVYSEPVMPFIRVYF